MPTFDGTNLLVTLDTPTAGVLDLDVQVDLYSDWKEFMLVGAGVNQRFPPLFTTFGGDAITADLDAGAYYTFNNTAGWRIKPDESDHDVFLVGNLVPLDPTLPLFIPTNGGFTVLILGLQPISQSVNVGAQVWDDEVLEDGETMRQSLRLIRAAAAGQIIQLADGSYLIKSKDGLIDRVDGSLGANNSRNIDATDSS